MQSIEIKDPFSFRGENNLFDHLQGQRVHGLYLWCIHLGDDRYRVYYIGESVDIGRRHRKHLLDCHRGRIKAHCLDSLRDDNVLIVKFRPDCGLIQRFAHLDRQQYLDDYIDSIHLFYTELPQTGDDTEDRSLRKRFENFVYAHIEDAGQNILHVGQTSSKSRGDPIQVRVETPGADIEALSGTTLSF